MAGGVWEWTSSGISDDYASKRRTTAYLIRGGAWTRTDPDALRATFRDANRPKSRSRSVGMRCARSR